MRNDFSKGKVWKNIIAQAAPLLLAQLVQLLYNVVDRIYIGHLPNVGSMALTGIGLAFPITTLIAAFTSLFGMGGAPLFSIARGAGKEQRAAHILSQVVMLLSVNAIAIFTLCYLYRKPILYLFGASDASYQYADAYLKIYLLGTFFSMFATGLNGFINAQGFPKTGMLTIVIGAILNLILDPVLIFVFHMGVEGAAIATVVSQGVSALWVLRFFIGKKTLYKITLSGMKPDLKLIKDIVALGMAGFIMQATNCAVQIVCNMTLKQYGGDLYVGIMTVLNSVREILSLPVFSIANGAQPVLGYNYGAKKYLRVRKGIQFTAILGFLYTIFAWFIVFLTPHFWLSIFTTDRILIETGAPALKLYFYGFCFMAFQFVGQSTFTSLGCAKRAIFFSLFRKIIIVVPLTLLLPILGFGVNGVFLAEPVSNIIGGLASFLTMWFSLYRKLPPKDFNETSR